MNKNKKIIKKNIQKQKHKYHNMADEQKRKYIEAIKIIKKNIEKT